MIHDFITVQMNVHLLCREAAKIDMASSAKPEIQENLNQLCIHV
jgi:hypothetical protein